jgi:hypothetical protein
MKLMHFFLQNEKKVGNRYKELLHRMKMKKKKVGSNHVQGLYEDSAFNPQRMKGYLLLFLEFDSAINFQEV